MTVGNTKTSQQYQQIQITQQQVTTDQYNPQSLTGHLAIGHTRYSTTGASVWQNAQPTFRPLATGGLALAHNGNLTNTEELAAVLASRGVPDPVPRKNVLDSTNDTALITELLASQPGCSGLEDAALAVLPVLVGAFSLVFMTETALYAARDRHGVRPPSSS